MSCLKESLKRGSIGLLMALFLSYTILVLSSIGHETMVIDVHKLLQLYCTYALSGFYLSAISIIFNIEKWSLFKQFTTHVLCTLPFLLIAYMTALMPENLVGRIIFIGLYLSSYIISYVIYRMHLVKEAKRINAVLQ